MSSSNGVAPHTRPLLALSQARSSGLTTATLALALCWPRPVLLVEADPAGGALAARFGLSPHPGLLSLAAGDEPTAGAVLAHAQMIGSVPALLAPVGSEATTAALARLFPALSATLTSLKRDVLVDCGRLGPGGGPVVPALPPAALLVLLARPSAEGVADLRHRLATLPAPVTSPPLVVLVGTRPYPPAEVADVLGVEVVGTLAVDPTGAELLASGVTTGLRLRRSALLRSAWDVAEALAERLAVRPSAPRSPVRLGAWRP